jgi:hypothetical protein
MAKRIRRPVTEQERALVLQKAAQGWGPKQLAKEFGRVPGVIDRILQQNKNEEIRVAQGKEKMKSVMRSLFGDVCDRVPREAAEMVEVHIDFRTREVEATLQHKVKFEI